MGRDSFVLYSRFRSQVERLSDAQAGVLFKTIFRYEAGEELPDMDLATEILFLVIKEHLDALNQKYEDTCRKRAEAGKRGGRPKSGGSEKTNGLDEKAKKANAFLEKQKNPDNENDNENDIKNIKTPPYPPLRGGTPQGIEPKKTKTTREAKALKNVQLFDNLAGDRFGEAKVILRAFMAYKGMKHNFAYEENGMKSLLNRVDSNIREYGVGAVIDLIDLTMENGWKGIIWDKLAQPRGQPRTQTRLHNFEERQDDLDATAREIMRQRLNTGGGT